MNNEIDILMNIYAAVSSNLDHIQCSKQRMEKITTDINNLGNNYFDSKIDDIVFQDYINMFNDDNMYQTLIINLDNLKLFIKDLINKKCEHEWMDDTIDINPDRSQNICYCVKCEVTKK
jgi:hypothetical protein